MVALPNPVDPTIEALKHAVKMMGQKQENRDYLGASLIGTQCSRQIFYTYNHYPKEPFEAETLWNFEDGNRTEDLIAARLRLIPGIELWTHDENGKQYGFSALNGKFRGHVDGVICGLLQAPKKNHIWENKSCA